MPKSRDAAVRREEGAFKITSIFQRPRSNRRSSSIINLAQHFKIPLRVPRPTRIYDNWRALKGRTASPRAGSVTWTQTRTPRTPRTVTLFTSFHEDRQTNGRTILHEDVFAREMVGHDPVHHARCFVPARFPTTLPKGHRHYGAQEERCYRWHPRLPRMRIACISNTTE